MMARPRRAPTRALRLAAAMLATLAGLLGALQDGAGADVAPERPAPGERVLVVDVVGVIGPATADYVAGALERAERGGYHAVLVRVDTPGGMLAPTRRIVQALLGARVPVLAHVGPAGGRAGSAGLFVVMAAHVASMTPGTHIGAAHPVNLFGGQQDRELAEKVVNDTAALVRSIAEQRDRNVEWADEAVRESVSATATEALDLGVVDLTARGERDLLEAVDGRTIELEGRTVTLRTAGAGLDNFPMTVQQRTLSVLGSPDVAYLLAMIGMLGIILELYNPGLVVPAVLGALCLLMAGIGLNLLPVDAGAVVLLVLAAGFLVAEVFVVSFGLLAVAGVVCLLIGSLLLIDTSDPSFLVDPSVRVSWTLVLPTVVVLAAVLSAVLVFLVRVQGRASTTGASGLVGVTGRATSPVDEQGGTVVVHGESWSAVGGGRRLDPGEPVRVVGVEGLVLHVEPAREAAGGPAGSGTT